MNTCTKKDLQKLPHKFQIMFAIFCAKQVINLVKEQDKEVCFKAIEAAEGFVEGRVTKEACYAAAYAANAAAYAYAANAASASAYSAYSAYSAAYTAANAANAAYAAYAANAAANAAYAANAAANAAYAAAYAANAAAYAAYAAASKQITEEQWSYYNELLTFEEEFEKILLGEV